MIPPIKNFFFFSLFSVSYINLQFWDLYIIVSLIANLSVAWTENKTKSKAKFKFQILRMQETK